jgi:hypothetical protein
MGSLDELSALASPAAAPLPPSLEALVRNSQLAAATEEESLVSYHEPVADLDVVRPLPKVARLRVAPASADAPSPDQAAVEALRGRWARTRATTRPDEDAVLVSYQSDAEVPPTWEASPAGHEVAVDGSYEAAGPAAEADGHDQGGDSINRGLLLKFLSSVRS